MAESEPTPSQDMKQYYVLGAVVLIAIAVAAYMLRPKTGSSTMTPTPVTQEQATAMPSPTPGPITKLGCDTQYFNPKIGFPEYYLSIEGGDVSAAKTVECSFTVMQKDKQIATTSVTSPLTDKPERGGSTFRCTTKAVAITPKTPMIVNVALKDDMGATSTCSGAFTFPSP